MKIVPLTKNYALDNADKILALEHNWKEIGDGPWNIDNLMYELPMKWELSHVALNENKIVGYQIGSLRDGAAFLNKIVVDKNERGFGIGRSLLKYFLEKCLLHHIECLRFRVRVNNPAVEFYDKLGFQKFGEIEYGRADGLPSYFYDNKIKEVLPNV